MKLLWLLCHIQNITVSQYYLVSIPYVETLHENDEENKIKSKDILFQFFSYFHQFIDWPTLFYLY